MGLNEQSVFRAGTRQHREPSGQDPNCSSDSVRQWPASRKPASSRPRRHAASFSLPKTYSDFSKLGKTAW